MSDSVEYRDGVFVATGPTPAVGSDGAAGTATGTALMVRPGDHLAPVDVPAGLASADLPPAGPRPPAPDTAPASGGARRIAVATIIASLVAAMAFGAAAFGGAFGGGGSTPSPGSGRSALGAAAATSAGATSVAFTLSASRTTSSRTTTLVTGSGAVDVSSHVGRLTASVPALASYVGSGDASVDVVTDGSAVYLGSPALSSLTGGATWLKADLPTGATSADLSSLAVLSNPSQLIGLLASAGGQVTTVGQVDLHGTRTTEYTTTVSLSELASRAGIGTAAAGSQVAKVLEQLGSTTVPITAWVGADGYLRQISASLDLSRATIGSIASDLIGGALTGTVPTGTAGQATTATTVTVGFDHYGAPVSVTVPPASRTTDVSSVVSSVQRAVSGIGHAVAGIASRF